MCRSTKDTDGPRTCASDARAAYGDVAASVREIRAEAAIVDAQLTNPPPSQSVSSTVTRPPKLKDLVGSSVRNGHVTETYRLLVRTQRQLNRELDEQGVSPLSPIRGVINRPVDAIVVTRNGQGHITGAVSLAVSDTRRYPSVSIHQLRAATWSTAGTGTALLTQTAMIARSLNAPMKVTGAVSDAIGFYERMGAEFANPHSHVGSWSSEARDRLADGVPVPGGASGRATASASTSGRRM